MEARQGWKFRPGTCFVDLEGIIQAGDGNAFLIAGLCIFNCRFMYFYYAENTVKPNWKIFQGGQTPLGNISGGSDPFREELEARQGLRFRPGTNFLLTSKNFLPVV